MSKYVDELLNTVIMNDYCVGCGNCASSKGSPLTMKISKDGKYMAQLDKEKNNEPQENVLEICPFSNSSKDENLIGDNLYKHLDGIKHSEYTGYYLNNYAGYVKEGGYREKGSSGGMGTWIAAKLLKEGFVDAIIHVKPASSDENNMLFSYQISKSVEELFQGAKSKYYPIEMSKVIEHVKNTPGRYAIIGIPCFIKAIRILACKDEQIRERIKYTIGLVCGHLKSDMFAKSIAWQMGIKPNELANIDFRVKIEGGYASNYGVKVKGLNNGTEVIKDSPTSKLYTTNWGQGLFKYKSCDYCDDVLAETADVTIGDAWLPEYIKDSMGTNIIVIRNPEIQKIVQDNIHELHLDEISVDKVFDSQAGGFRHRREGLAYRIYLKDKDNEWRPKKRIQASNNISSNRRKIYEKRIELYEESYKAYKIAQGKDDFNMFVKHMDPFIKKYKKLITKPFVLRAIGKIKRTIFR